MSEYPEDVMRAANEVVTQWKTGGTSAGLMPLIALALMAERERAAAEFFGDEEKPRYTTKRLRLEVDRAKASATLAERERHTVLQRNLRDMFDAICAMRDSINEHIPMPSLESDLLHGPEPTVFCSVLAESVINAITRTSSAASSSVLPPSGREPDPRPCS